MNSFTFISLSYNQEEYIIEHLDSIKKLVEYYGKGLKIDYILADDCSIDGTLEKAREWLNKNDGVFNDIRVLDRKKNVGIVKNMLCAVKHTKTEHFKILAADDRFKCKDIFSLYRDMNHELIFTPADPIDLMGNKEYRAAKNMDKNFQLVRMLKTPDKMKKMLKCQNFLFAPGVFIPGELLRNTKFQKFLLQFRNIEDYPMFYYFFTYCECGVKIVNEHYVEYRVGSGISTDKGNEKRKYYDREIKKMHKIMDIKLYKYPKYMNPYKYYFIIVRSLCNIYLNF